MDEDDDNDTSFNSRYCKYIDYNGNWQRNGKELLKQDYAGSRESALRLFSSVFDFVLSTPALSFGGSIVFANVLFGGESLRRAGYHGDLFGDVDVYCDTHLMPLVVAQSLFAAQLEVDFDEFAASPGGYVRSLSVGGSCLQLIDSVTMLGAFGVPLHEQALLRLTARGVMLARQLNEEFNAKQILMRTRRCELNRLRHAEDMQQRDEDKLQSYHKRFQVRIGTAPGADDNEKRRKFKRLLAATQHRRDFRHSVVFHDVARTIDANQIHCDDVDKLKLQKADRKSVV